MRAGGNWRTSIWVAAALLGCGRGQPKDAGAQATSDRVDAPATTENQPKADVEAEPRPEPEPPPPSEPSLIEAPLPPLAMARLGTTALRHGDVAQAVASSADAGLVASADAGAIRVWSTADGARVAELPARDTRALAFSADSETLVAAGADGLCHVIDLASGKETTTLRLLANKRSESHGRIEPASAVAISTDAALLAAGHEGGKIAVWDLGNREREAMFDSGLGYVGAIAISPDRSLLAACDHDDRGASVAIFARETGERLATLTPQLGLIQAIALTPDNARIVLGTQREGIHVWSIAEAALVRTLAADAVDTRALWISADGSTVYAPSHSRNAIRSFDLATGAEGPRMSGHGGTITDLAVSADGTLLASTSLDHTVGLWTVADAEPRFSSMGHAGAVDDIAWSGDGSKIATVALDGELRLWNAQSYALERTIAGPPGHHHQVALSRDASTIVVNAEREVRVIDGATGELRHTLEHDGRTFAVAVTQDGARVASGGFDGLRIWAEGAQLHHVPHRHKRVASLAFAPDGATLASGWDDGRVRIIDVATGAVALAIRTNIEVDSLAYDGTRLAARTGIDSFAVWELQLDGEDDGDGDDDDGDGGGGDDESDEDDEDDEGDEDDDDGPPEPVRLAKIDLARPLAFGAGGNLVLATGLAGDAEHFVYIVDVNSGAIVRPYMGHDGAITAAVFSPDDLRFASASEDTTALIWVAP